MSDEYESGILTLISDYYDTPPDDDYERYSATRAMRVFDALDKRDPDLLSDEVIEACLGFARGCFDYEPRRVNKRAWTFFVANAAPVFVLDESAALSQSGSGALQQDARRELDCQKQALGLLDEPRLADAYFTVWRPETRAIIFNVLARLTSYPTVFALVGARCRGSRDAAHLLRKLGRPSAQYLESICLGGGPDASLACAILLGMGEEASPSLFAIAEGSDGRIRERCLGRLAEVADDKAICRLWGQTVEDMHECAKSRFKAMGESALPLLVDVARTGAFAEEAVQMLRAFGPRALPWLHGLADLRLPCVAEAEHYLTGASDDGMAWQVDRDAIRY